MPFLPPNQQRQSTEGTKKTGYQLRHIIYTGKSTFERDSNKLFSEQVVTSLLQGYESKGHVVYFDNFYSSPELFATLESKGIGACGTVRVMRRHMPSDLKPQNLRLQKGDAPVFRRAGNLVACAWHDIKRVHFLSTLHTDNIISKRIRHRAGTHGYRTVEKPVIHCPCSGFQSSLLFI